MERQPLNKRETERMGEYTSLVRQIENVYGAMERHNIPLDQLEKLEKRRIEFINRTRSEKIKKALADFHANRDMQSVENEE